MDEKKRKKIERISQLAQDGELALFKYLLDIEEKIDEEIPELKNILKRVKGDKGETPTKEEIIKLIKPLIPVVKNGADYVLTSQDKKEIVKAIKVPVAEKVINNTETIREVFDTDKVALKASKLAEVTLKTLIPTSESIAKNIPVLGEKVRDSLEILNGDERLDINSIRGLGDYKEVSEMARRPFPTYTPSGNIEILEDGVKKGLSKRLNFSTGLDVALNGNQVDITVDPTELTTINWGNINGTLTDQTDLTTYISDQLATQDTLQEVTDNGSITTNNIEALSFTKTGGTSSQFLKADGSVDSNTYLTTEVQTLAGISLLSDNTAKSLYTMTSGVDVEFEDSSNATILYLDESTGNVGIGTTAPDEMLHLEASSGYGARMTLKNTHNSSTTINFDSNRTSTGSGLGGFTGYWNGNRVNGVVFASGDDTTNKDEGFLRFFTRDTGEGDWSEKMRLSQDGNVGIGTDTPDELLHLQATGISGRETLLKANVSDAGNDFFGVGNGTSTAANFAPTFIGYKDSNYGSGYIYSLNFRGLIPTSQDITNINRFGIVHFEVFNTDNAADPNNNLDGAVVNRTLYTFANGSDTLLQIDANGDIGIRTTAPTEALDINSDAIRVRNDSTPASASATGAKGEIRWDSSYVYVCTATDTWKRTAIATW